LPYVRLRARPHILWGVLYKLIVFLLYVADPRAGEK